MADRVNGRGPASGAVRATLAFGAGAEAAPIVVGIEPGTGTGQGQATPARVDGQSTAASLELLGDSRAMLTDDAGGSHHVLVIPLPDARRAATGITRVEVVVDGWRFEVDLENEAHARLRERATGGNGGTARGGPLELRAIIPGRVVSVDVAEGDTVEAGARLLVVEAMKMQNELRTPRAGTVGRVDVGPGQRVELGDLLLVVE